MMVEQADVDRLLADLESMRSAMGSDRASLRPQLEAMVQRVEQMRQEAAGGKFEAAINSVSQLLESLQRGVAAQDELNRAAP